MGHLLRSRAVGIVAVAGLLGVVGCGGGNGGSPTPTGGAGGGIVTMLGGMGGTVINPGTGGNGGAAPSVALLVQPTTVTVNEGGAGVPFAVSLSAAFQSPITVTITSANPAIATTQEQVVVFDANTVGPKMVTILGAQDKNTVNDTTIVTLTAPEAATAVVQVNVIDDDTQAMLVTPTQVSMLEGSSTQIGVRLAFQPATTTIVTLTDENAAKLMLTPGTLTFDASNYDVPQQVTLNAPPDPDQVDDLLNVTATSPDVVTAFNVPVTIIDKDVLNLDVSPPSLTVQEGSTTPGVVMVKLTKPPAGDLVVTVMPSSTAKVSASVPTLTFTAANYATAQLVNVLAVADDDTKDEHETVTFAAATLTSRSVQVTVHDNNTQSIVVTPTPLSVNEGGTTTFTVRMAFDPGMAIGVNVFSSNTSKVTLDQSTLLFNSTNYKTPQTVTVTGQQDLDLHNEAANITLLSSAADSVTVPVAVVDDDVQSIKLSYGSAPGVLNMQETQKNGSPSTATVGVSLAFQPDANVVVSMSSSDAARLKLSNTLFQFSASDYATPKITTLTAAHDDDTLNNDVSVSFSGDGLSVPVILPVHITDLDVQNFVITPVTGMPTLPGIINENATTQFTVKLAFAPVAPVTATITSDNPAVVVTVNPASCVLATETASCTVSVMGMKDNDTVDATGTVTVADAASVIAPQTLGVTIKDIDVLALIVSAANPIIVNNDGTVTGTFQVKLSNVPPAPVSILMTPSVGNAVTLNPASGFMLTGADATTDHPVTVTGVTDYSLQTTFLTIDVGAVNASTLVPLTGVADKFITVRKDNVNPLNLVLTDPACNVPAYQMNDVGLTGGFHPMMMATGAGLSPATQLLLPAGSDFTFCVGLSAVPPQTQIASITTNLTSSFAGSMAFSVSGSGNTLQYLTSSATAAPPVTQQVTVHIPADNNLDNDTGTIAVNLMPNATARTIYITSINQNTQSITLSSPTVMVHESKQTDPASTSADKRATFTVSLPYIPRQDPLSGMYSEVITPTVTTGAGKVLVTPPSLTFNDVNHATAQTFTVTSVADDDAVNENGTTSGAPSPVITLQSNKSGTPSKIVTVAVQDDDTMAFQLTGAPSNSLTMAEGAMATFGVRLTAQPRGSATVRVFLAPSAQTPAVTITGGVTTDGTGQWFDFDSTNWNTAQTVTLTAGTDADCNANPATTISISSSGGAPIPSSASLTVNVTDNSVCMN